MENRTINISVVAEVAKALHELKDQMVFIGGAVVSLYADDPAADEIRPTADIDMAINLLNFSNWVRMQERLSELSKSSRRRNSDTICTSISSYQI